MNKKDAPKKFSTKKLEVAFDIKEIIWTHENKNLIKKKYYYNSLIEIHK